MDYDGIEQHRADDDGMRPVFAEHDPTAERRRKDGEKRMAYVTMAGITRELGIDDREFREYLYGKSPDGVYSKIVSSFRHDYPGKSLVGNEFVSYASARLSTYVSAIEEMKLHRNEIARFEGGE